MCFLKKKKRDLMGMTIGVMFLSAGFSFASPSISAPSIPSMLEDNARIDAQNQGQNGSSQEEPMETEKERKYRNDTREEREPALTKCSTLDRLTTYPVKFIEGNLYLDSRGYKVLPCGKENQTRFSIVEKYEDGEAIYNQSKNQPVNLDGMSMASSSKDTNAYTPNIYLNFDESYEITYGSNPHELRDVEEFQKKLNLSEMTGDGKDKDNNLNKSFSEKDLMEAGLDEAMYEDLSSYFAVTKEMKELPDQYKKFIAKEKEEEIRSLYNEIVQNISKQESEENKKMEDEFIATAVADNRMFILPMENGYYRVINQYLVDQKYDKKGKARESLTDENGNPMALDENGNVVEYGKINGNLFHFYKVQMAKKNFSLASKQFVKEYVATPKRSLDEKLAVMDYIKNHNDFFTESANVYYNKMNTEWGKLFTNQPKLIQMGESEYKKAGEKEKMEYANYVMDINERIIRNEFDNLPGTITRAQYMTLSNLDKYKYVPQKEGNFTNKKMYDKNQKEKVLKLTVSDKK